MKMTRTYRTSDIYVASWLLSKGLQLQGIDRCDKQRVYFIFIDPDIGTVILNEGADYRKQK